MTKLENEIGTIRGSFGNVHQIITPPSILQSVSLSPSLPPFNPVSSFLDLLPSSRRINHRLYEMPLDSAQMFDSAIAPVDVYLLRVGVWSIHRESQNNCQGDV